MSSLSRSLPIGVAASRPKTMPTRPVACANSMSRRSRTTVTRSWWAMSAWRIPRSVTTSSHCQGVFPVTYAVPSIMLSNTAVRPDAARPANAVCWRPVRLYGGVSAMSAGNRTG